MGKQQYIPTHCKIKDSTTVKDIGHTTTTTTSTTDDHDDDGIVVAYMLKYTTCETSYTI